MARAPQFAQNIFVTLEQTLDITVYIECSFKLSLLSFKNLFFFFHLIREKVHPDYRKKEVDEFQVIL